MKPSVARIVIGGLGWANAWAARICVMLAALLIMGMTVVVIAGVYYRYILNNSIGWTEEVAILSAIWVAFLVAPHAYRRGMHVSIEMIIQALPGPLMRLLRIVLNIAILWILYRYFVESLNFVQRGNFQRANTLNVQTSWFRSVVPASLAMMALVGVELILRDLAALVLRDKGFDLPPPHAPQDNEPTPDQEQERA